MAIKGTVSVKELGELNGWRGRCVFFKKSGGRFELMAVDVDIRVFTVEENCRRREVVGRRKK